MQWNWQKVTFNLLNKDDTLCNRTDLTMDDIEIALNFFLNKTYFTFQGKYYQQIYGVLMGSSNFCGNSKLGNGVC